MAPPAVRARVTAIWTVSRRVKGRIDLKRKDMMIVKRGWDLKMRQTGNRKVMQMRLTEMAHEPAPSLILAMQLTLRIRLGHRPQIITDK